MKSGTHGHSISPKNPKNSITACSLSTTEIQSLCILALRPSGGIIDPSPAKELSRINESDFPKIKELVVKTSIVMPLELRP